LNRAPRLKNKNHLVFFILTKYIDVKTKVPRAHKINCSLLKVEQTRKKPEKKKAVEFLFSIQIPLDRKNRDKQ
jgi:hypothetical protein